MIIPNYIKHVYYRFKCKSYSILIVGKANKRLLEVGLFFAGICYRITHNSMIMNVMMTQYMTIRGYVKETAKKKISHNEIVRNKNHVRIEIIHSEPSFAAESCTVSSSDVNDKQLGLTPSWFIYFTSELSWK